MNSIEKHYKETMQGLYSEQSAQESKYYKLETDKNNKIEELERNAEETNFVIEDLTSEIKELKISSISQEDKCNRYEKEQEQLSLENNSLRK